MITKGSGCWPFLILPSNQVAERGKATQKGKNAKSDAERGEIRRLRGEKSNTKGEKRQNVAEKG